MKNTLMSLLFITGTLVTLAHAFIWHDPVAAGVTLLGTALVILLIDSRG